MRMTRLILIGAVILAAGAAQAAKPQIVFPQGAEQPLAALQDIDVIEHLGDRVPAGLAFSDGAGNPVAHPDRCSARASRCWSRSGTIAARCCAAWCSTGW